MQNAISKKQKTREKILHSATEYFRRYGLSGASVQTVMKHAGLTVGGFYAHFRSKEDLIKKAFEKMAEQAQEYIAQLPGKTGAERAKAFLNVYLGNKHRDHYQQSCPVASLVNDMAREGLEVRRIFAEELEKLMQQRGELFYERTPTENEKRQMYAWMCLYVGAISVAKAARGTPTSDYVLKSAREFLSREMEKL